MPRGGVRTGVRQGTVKVGRTIAQEWEKQESESERLAARKKNKNKRIITVLTVIVLGAGVGLIGAMQIAELLRERTDASTDTPQTIVYQPTVEIIDENGSGITRKMKAYVGQIETDFAALGYGVSKAVIPAGKMREVDVYLEPDFSGYIKLNLDRGTAVSAEDADRMIRYLNASGAGAEYIDVRVEGKGYYK